MFDDFLKKTLVVLFFLAFLFTFPANAENEKKRIAVFPFYVNSIDVAGVSSHDAGNVVAKMLINELIKTQKFSVVQYDEVLNVLDEMNLSEAPLDEETQKKAAKKLGVEAIVVGWIERFEVSSGGGGVHIWGGYSADVDTTSADVELEANLVAGHSASLLEALKESGSDSDSSVGVMVDYYGVDLGSNDFYQSVLGHAAQEAVQNLATELADASDKIEPPPEGYVDLANLLEGLVADVSETEVTINIGSGDGVKTGGRFNIFRVDKEIIDPETGEVIKRVEKEIGEIVILEAGDGWSTGNIVNLEDGEIIQVTDIVREAK